MDAEINNIENVIKEKHKHDIDVQYQLLHRIKTDDAVLRLFSVNYNLCQSIDRFKDDSMKIWMDDVYKYVYYTWFDGETKKINAMDFNKYSGTNIRNYGDIFGMIIAEQIGSYFQGHNASTVTDITQYMGDMMESFNFIPNIIDRQQIDRICQSIFYFILYSTLKVSTPLYFISRLFNIIFPLVMMILFVGVQALKYRSFVFIITVCYYLSILLLIMTWYINVDIGIGKFRFIQYRCGHDVGKLIFSLCPSLYRPGELYVSLKYGYFTQHELFERIIWHYNRHRYAEIEGQIVIDKFGKDIAREIFDFFPTSYSEEKIACSN